MKKQKAWIEILLQQFSHNECIDVLLNNKCIRHSMNRIQSKDHRLGTCKINKISCHVLYIQNNGYDE